MRPVTPFLFIVFFLAFSTMVSKPDQETVHPEVGGRNVQEDQLPEITGMTKKLPAPYLSSIVYFKSLLPLTLENRLKSIQSKSPETQKLLLQKLSEYDKLNGREQEIRLKEASIRIHLKKLVKMSLEERRAVLVILPEEESDILQKHLARWDQLNPGLQKEFFNHEIILRYFSRIGENSMASQNMRFNSLSPGYQRHYENWIKLKTGEKEKVFRHFDEFFKLNGDEKEKILGALSKGNRSSSMALIQSYQNMEKSDRGKCIQSLKRFTDMNPLQQQRFLWNAGRWATMSEETKTAIRKLLAEYPPTPPLPPGMPPIKKPQIPLGKKRPDPPRPPGLKIPTER